VCGVVSQELYDFPDPVSRKGVGARGEGKGGGPLSSSSPRMAGIGKKRDGHTSATS